MRRRCGSRIWPANSNSAEWSADGRFIYYLSNRGGSTQVWRLAPGGDPLQITNLPLEVGSFRVSPKADRVLVSLEVYLDCADLACTKQRLDTARTLARTGCCTTRCSSGIGIPGATAAARSSLVSRSMPRA
jgi:dipeptidyl aminopeptidase/acylaminoacyl peptidase